jgi:hypothetical protein
VYLCEAFLAVPPNFPLLKSYFFVKYQPSADNQKVIGSVGIQTHPRNGFLDLPMKTLLKRWHKSWSYCENHEPSLSPSLADSPIIMKLGLKSLHCRTPPRGCPIQSSQCPKKVWLDRSLCGCQLASPSGNTPKEIGPPCMGVQRSSGSDSGNIQQYRGQQGGKTTARDVQQYQQLPPR